ncbi:hypothetical protein BGX21_010418 [Mortierella sp. AD011]|nr:hypothetical protein BGX20_002038 [Mortierella sp. AD010]KAF9394305.1 hypothetical protein BGX21_010418 [Mortierella sp. AD011]
MQTALAHHCQQCLSVIRKTTFLRISCQTPLNMRSPRIQTAPVVFSSSQYQQVREAFLRAGPGREIGATLRKSPTPPPPPSSSSSSSALLQSSQFDPTSTDELDTPDQERDLDSEIAPPTSSATTEASTETPPPHSRKPHAAYKEIVLLETDFRERFIKGGGNGGQKINKTNSNVELKHFETGIVVQCQATRSLPQNRKLARRILIDRLDEYYNGDMSKRGKKAEKIRQRKMRMARKSAKKYHGTGSSSPGDLEEEGDDDFSDDNSDIDDDTHEEGGTGNRGGKENAKAKLDGNQIPESTIQLTTLEEILASDNKKPSRRKAGRKE